MSYTHRIHYTKNLLDGPRQGEQPYGQHNCHSALEAARVALDLNTGGVHRDPWTGETFTAHNVFIVDVESELPELVTEYEAGRYDAADRAYDAMIEASL